MSNTKSEKWAGIFNGLTENSTYAYDHQRSGWTDIEDPEEWKAYVTDVFHNHCRPGDSVFEVGVGMGGFVGVMKKSLENITIGGVDAAPASLALARKTYPDCADRFVEGFCPSALENIPSESYDLVVSNSVFQYLPSRDACFDTLAHMLRIAKPNGVVILGDVCDAVFEDEIQSVMQAKYANSDSYFKGQRAPDYNCFLESEWQRFAGGDANVEVSTRRVEVESYYRRRLRYCAYFKKNSSN